MNKKTAKALEGSIKKWELIVSGEWRNLGGSNCPLCKLFALSKQGSCGECPVAQKTGNSDCIGTPYYDFVDHASWDGRACTPEAKKHARRMLRFLKSLR